MTTPEQRKELIRRLLKGIETGDPASVAVVNEAKYIQHNPQTHEGSEGLAALFARLAKTNPRVNVVRAFADGDFVSDSEVAHHVSNIVSGQYSFVGTRDSAMIEYRVETDPFFAPVTFQGVPDIRVLVVKGYPIMAMVRLPTRRSRGKANLHQGAIGVGIALHDGRTLNGVLGNDVVDLDDVYFKTVIS